LAAPSLYGKSFAAFSKGSWSSHQVKYLCSLSARRFLLQIIYCKNCFALFSNGLILLSPQNLPLGGFAGLYDETVPWGLFSYKSPLFGNPTSRISKFTCKGA